MSNSRYFELNCYLKTYINILFTGKLVCLIEILILFNKQCLSQVARVDRLIESLYHTFSLSSYLKIYKILS